MKMYEAKHRCGCKLIIIDDNYKGGSYPYCKKCHINVKLTPVNVKNPEFKFKEVPVLVPITNNYSECQCQSQSINTG